MAFPFKTSCMVMMKKARLVCEAVGDGGLTRRFQEVAAHDAIGLKKDLQNPPKFICPTCDVSVVAVKPYLQTFYTDTGEAITLEIPSHFRRPPKGIDHQDGCKIGRLQREWQSAGSRLRSLRSDVSSVLYNLNIIVRDMNPLNRTPKIFGSSQDSVSPREGRTRTQRILSQGVNHVESLRDLVEDNLSAFGAFKQIIPVRFFGKVLTLDQIYWPHEKIRDLFNRTFREAKENFKDVSDPVLIDFKPIAHPRFWNKQAQTVQGQAFKDSTGRSLSVLLHFKSPEAFDQMTGMINKGRIRNFMIFAEKAYLDLADCRAKQDWINKGQSPKGKTFFLHLDVVSADQFCKAQRIKGQLDLESVGLFGRKSRSASVQLTSQ